MCDVRRECIYSMNMRGCVKEVVIAIIMCVIKPSALLAIRITLEHVDGIGCYCMCSGSFGYTMIFHAPQSLFSDLLRTFTHRHFSQKKNTQTFRHLVETSSNLSVFSFESHISISSHWWYFYIVRFLFRFFALYIVLSLPFFLLMLLFVFDFR